VLIPGARTSVVNHDVNKEASVIYIIVKRPVDRPEKIWASWEMGPKRRRNLLVRLAFVIFTK
jgi:hypothetical protein